MLKRLLLYCTLTLLPMPLLAQWSGSLDLSGGYGSMPLKNKIKINSLNHGLMQAKAGLKYQTPQWTWNTTLDGKWEPKNTDSYHATAKADYEVVIKEMTTRPLATGLRSELIWTPGPDRKYETWISYRYNHNDGENSTVHVNVSRDESDWTISCYYEVPEMNEHVVSTGFKTSHQLGTPRRELFSSWKLDASTNRQYNDWGVLDPTGFTPTSIEKEDFDDHTPIWYYRITPQRRNLALSGQVHFRDSVMRGPVRLVLDPGIRLSSRHDLDQNSGATLDLEEQEKGNEVWRDSLRLRENFDYLTLQTEPYLAGDLSWQTWQVHFDYALQLYARRLNDDTHTQRLSLHGAYPVGNGSISWRPSGKHRLSLNNRLSVSHPSYYQICWYERTGGYLDQLYQGNDKLRSSVSSLYSIEYEFKPGRFSSNTTLSMTRLKNETDQTWTEQEIDGRQYKVFTWINSADSWTFGARERLGWTGKILTTHLELGYNQTQRVARQTGEVKKSFNWNLAADASAELGRGWSLRTDVRYQSKVATFFAMFNEYCVLNARIQKRFPAVTLYLEGRDLLDNAIETTYSSADNTEQWIESIRNNRRLIVLGLKWDIR